MPKKQFAIESDGEHQLELTWGSFWRDFTVYLDGAPIGELSPRELRTGQSFLLPGGSELKVRLRQSLLAAELEVLQDGRPLPGSATDPIQRVRQATTVIFIIGGFNLLLGIVGIFVETEWMSLLGAGWGTAVFGIFLLILGWLVKQRHSQPALITAIVIYLADSLLGMLTIIGAGDTPGIASIIIRAIFIIIMIQGAKALNEIKLDERRLETGD
jgi:hypothetical protein